MGSRRRLEAVPLSRNLTIVNFRPEYSADWMRHSFYQQVPLVPSARTRFANC